MQWTQAESVIRAKWVIVLKLLTVHNLPSPSERHSNSEDSGASGSGCGTKSHLQSTFHAMSSLIPLQSLPQPKYKALQTSRLVVCSQAQVVKVKSH